MNHKFVLSRFFVRVQSALLAIFFCFVFSSAGQENKLDLQALVRDTQKMVHEEHQLTLVWWIPDEFWRATLSANPDMSASGIERVVKTVHAYTLVAVMKGTLGSFGAMTYEREQTIRSELAILDSSGKQYKPLDEADVGPDLQNLLTMMKPILGNMMGPMGKNIDFYTFPANTSDGKPFANPKKDGNFTVQLGEQKFQWRLPLGSLLPPKICPQCGEKLSGAYKFCPFDGTALKVAQ